MQVLQAFLFLPTVLGVCRGLPCSQVVFKLLVFPPPYIYIEAVFHGSRWVMLLTLCLTFDQLHSQHQDFTYFLYIFILEPCWCVEFIFSCPPVFSLVYKSLPSIPCGLAEGWQYWVGFIKEWLADILWAWVGLGISSWHLLYLLPCWLLGHCLECPCFHEKAYTS